jgi:hypothetical protein
MDGDDAPKATLDALFLARLQAKLDAALHPNRRQSVTV